MEMESYNSLGETITVLALFAQGYTFGQRTPLYKKDTKQNQNSPMATTTRWESKRSIAGPIESCTECDPLAIAILVVSRSWQS